MQSQVIFKTDGQLKRAAQKKAKQEGISLKMVLNHCMKDYVDGKIHFYFSYQKEPEVEVLQVSPDLQKKMDKIADLLK